jgi:hypothetical protein
MRTDQGGKAMSTTTKLPRERLAEYFDTFTKRFLRDESPEAVDIEVLEPELGDQRAAHAVRLVGITFDRHTNALEIALDSGDHRVYHPQEVWVREEDDTFPSAIEVIRPDGAREVLSLKRIERPHA